MQKVHVENFSRENSQKIDKNLDVSFSSIFLVLLRFPVLLSDGSSKTLQKTFYKKNRVEKFLQENRQKSKTDFFLDFFHHVFGRFSVRGVKKHDKKSHKKSDQPWYFFGLRGTNQPPQGPSNLFLSAP
jgi:hypothetical protein